MDWPSASAIATAVRNGESARDILETTLDRIAKHNPALNAFTAVLTERARSKAAAIDAMRHSKEPLGALAGVPFGVKNLFNIAGVTTLAGSKINRNLAPATQDATLITRLEAAGAILVGALNMGEYAYDFTGENEHYGASRNPHDVTRMTGGSSGGSAAAVAGGLVPLALGSDTNGSIRVPSSFCGIFGLKPTYGRLSRARTFPFVASLDHVGPFARTAHDLALAYDVMQGHDPNDPVCVDRPVEPATPQLQRGTQGLRIAVAGGYFQKGLFPEARQAVARVVKALGITQDVEVPEAERARSAAYVITAAEGSALHLDRLRARAHDFGRASRDRLLAGAMVPAALVIQAQKVRRHFRAQMLQLLKHVDAIIASATAYAAPLIGQQILRLDGKDIPLRPIIGLYTQPFSFIGLPVVAVPIPLKPLPIAVQIICAPWREDLALRIAHELEQAGVAAAPRP